MASSSSTHGIARGLPSNPRSRTSRPNPNPTAQTSSQIQRRHPLPTSSTHSRNTLTPDEQDVHSTELRSKSSSDWSNVRSVVATRNYDSTKQSEYRGVADKNNGSEALQTSNEPDMKDDNFVWNRVAEVANVFTKEVSKVWATGLAPLSNADDDVEDQDGESHLTRVMRAYHLSKARTPSELPDWLFSERERGLGKASRKPMRVLSEHSMTGKGDLTSSDRLKQIRKQRRKLA